MTLTFDIGHVKWYALKVLAKGYYPGNFHISSDDNLHDNANVTEFQRISVTLVESRYNWHALKGFAKDYHCVSFHDCSDDGV